MIRRDDVGQSAYELIEELYPICRSITGDGVRQTLDRLCNVVPLQVHEVPSGTRVLDWLVPDEWNIRDAWIKDDQGNRVVDFRSHNLHVVNYSEPIQRVVSRTELLEHVHSLPDHPDWIPYRTAYYKRDWGFCVSQRQLDSLKQSQYEVCIDSSLEPGHLTYGEVYLPGESERELVISSHVCHPSLCNDNLSGVCIAILLAQHWSKLPRRLSLRFLFAPGTIGAITWLARNRDQLDRILGGVTLTCLGDKSPFTYKRSWVGDSTIDRAAERSLKTSPYEHKCIDFFPYGYDERQYNSPAFRLPFGSLMRARHQQFDEYHTSADDLSFIDPTHLQQSYDLLNQLIQDLQNSHYFRNAAGEAEPQLGRRGVFPSLNGDADLQMAALWTLNLSDGNNSLVDVAERSNMPISLIEQAAKILNRFDLLMEV
ncbi:MAG: DUF4910 domain-containing protein [Planctomycetota bacterium]